MTMNTDGEKTEQTTGTKDDVGLHSRWRFLKSAGAGALGAALLGTGAFTQGAVLPVSAASDLPAREIQEGDSAHFGRIFGNLPFFGQDMPSDALTAALRDIGRPGGILDAQDDLAAGPVALITDPALSAHNANNPTHTAGTTFVGQFLDHDLTFDVGSPLGVPTDPTTAPNGRTPALDLDSVYGGGPLLAPHLYDASRTMFLIESGGLYEDLPRTTDGRAIIPEPRNDENLVISGLHCAVLLFHNAAVDWVTCTTDITDPAAVFAAAQQLTIWHYQWMIVHEFLPLVVGQTMVDDILASGRTVYRPRHHVPFIPVEFQGACYRMGHSMVRPSYRANFTGDNDAPFFALIFDSSQSDTADPADLSGGHRAPRRFVGWHTFFDFGDGNVKPNKRIDTAISSPLFSLPLRAIASHDLPTALPQRTLLRHITWSLPSGQSVARALGVPVLSPDDLGELRSYGLGLETSTPLWYYTLKEAEILAQGLTLGPMGGRIVAEVVIGLLQLDRASYIQTDWNPVLPQADGEVTGDFGMVDFLTFAGVGDQR